MSNSFSIIPSALAMAAFCISGSVCAAENAACVPLHGAVAIKSNHVLPPYPYLSVLNREEGTVVLEITIGNDGVPSNVKVANSSGFANLDEASLMAVKSFWRWTPPLNECGSDAPVTRVSMKWDLKYVPSGVFSTITMGSADFPPDALAKHEQGTTVVVLTFAADGSIADQHVVRTSGFADLDDKSMELVKRRNYRAPSMTMGGKPTLPVTVVWKRDEND